MVQDFPGPFPSMILVIFTALARVIFVTYFQVREAEDEKMG